MMTLRAQLSPNLTQGALASFSSATAVHIQGEDPLTAPQKIQGITAGRRSQSVEVFSGPVGDSPTLQIASHVLGRSFVLIDLLTESHDAYLFFFSCTFFKLITMSLPV
jgi:hypothetical protein